MHRWLSTMCVGLAVCAVLATGTARAEVPAGQGARAVLVAEGPLQHAAAAADDEQNPWDTFLWAPMYLPFPGSALVDGWLPWGRYAWVKNLTAACLVGCGGLAIAAFPFTLLFAVLGLALAVVGAVFAVYAFITQGFSGGCCGVARRGSDVTNSCFSVYNGLMCLSFAVCTPWLGFKLIQRGWYAFRTPIEPPVDEAPAPKRPRGKSADEAPAADPVRAGDSTPSLAY